MEPGSGQELKVFVPHCCCRRGRGLLSVCWFSRSGLCVELEEASFPSVPSVALGDLAGPGVRRRLSHHRDPVPFLRWIFARRREREELLLQTRGSSCSDRTRSFPLLCPAPAARPRGLPGPRVSGSVAFHRPGSPPGALKPGMLGPAPRPVAADGGTGWGAAVLSLRPARALVFPFLGIRDSWFAIIPGLFSAESEWGARWDPFFLSLLHLSAVLQSGAPRAPIKPPGEGLPRGSACSPRVPAAAHGDAGPGGLHSLWCQTSVGR